MKDKIEKSVHCKVCKYCEFEDYKGRPNRYYCVHPLNPSSVNHTAGATIVCKTKRHETEMTIKRTPSWCPLKGETKNA